MMRKKRLLLLGAGGMAGHIAYHYLNSLGKYEIQNVVFRKKLTADSLLLDVTDTTSAEKLIRSARPDIIINCIGVLIRGSNSDPGNAIFINAYFPHWLERIAADINSKLIHISTDCVFSGKKGDYEEMDERDADDTYGKSKGLGEIINNKDLTIRTSIIGPELKENGEGLFYWFMQQKGEINGYTQAFWGGVTTLELAKSLDVAIDQDVKGLVHLTNGEKITKYDLLNLVKEIWRKEDVIIKPYQGKSVDKSLKKSGSFGYEVPTYRQMLIELQAWMSDHSGLYNNMERI